MAHHTLAVSTRRWTPVDHGRPNSGHTVSNGSIQSRGGGYAGRARCVSANTSPPVPKRPLPSSVRVRRWHTGFVPTAFRTRSVAGGLAGPSRRGSEPTVDCPIAGRNCPVLWANQAESASTPQLPSSTRLLPVLVPTPPVIPLCLAGILDFRRPTAGNSPSRAGPDRGATSNCGLRGWSTCSKLRHLVPPPPRPNSNGKSAISKVTATTCSIRRWNKPLPHGAVGRPSHWANSCSSDCGAVGKAGAAPASSTCCACAC